MVGCPKTFNTKMDYINSIENFPEQTLDSLRQLLSSRFIFVKSKELPTESAGKSDAAHWVAVETERNEKDEEVKKIYQMVKQEDENARLFLLGFTVKEVEELIEKNKYRLEK